VFLSQSRYWELPEIHTLCHDIKCDRHTVVAVAYKERLLKCGSVSRHRFMSKIAPEKLSHRFSIILCHKV